MALKTQTHAGQANPNIKAQENTLSAKPLSPFKPKSAVKQSQTKPVPQTQTEPIPKSQTVGLSEAKQTQTKKPQPLNPSREQTLSPSRRQFIEQYGAYALVTPVALYAMMSPNRAMAQAGSVGVIDDRPRILLNNERIENFDIDTHIDGIIEEDGDLELLHDEKYIAPDGAVYTCDSNNCAISADGYVNSSRLTVTYPNDIGLSNQAAADAVDDIVDDVAADAVDDIVADAVADAVADDSPRFLVKGERIETFDFNAAAAGGIARKASDGVFIQFSKGWRFTAPDGVVYTCTTRFCSISSLGVNELGIFSYRPR